MAPGRYVPATPLGWAPVLVALVVGYAALDVLAGAPLTTALADAFAPALLTTFALFLVVTFLSLARALVGAMDEE